MSGRAALGDTLSKAGSHLGANLLRRAKQNLKFSVLNRLFHRLQVYYKDTRHVRLTSAEHMFVWNAFVVQICRITASTHHGFGHKTVD